jgi:hypothetical protein
MIYKRLMVETITRDKKGKAKERPKDVQHMNQKERERASPFRGMKLFHSWPF